MTSEELKSQLLQLPQDVRAELAFVLIESLDVDQQTDSDDEFRETLLRRETEIRNGSTIGVSAEVVMERLRKKFA